MLMLFIYSLARIREVSPCMCPAVRVGQPFEFSGNQMVLLKTVCHNSAAIITIKLFGMIMMSRLLVFVQDYGSFFAELTGPMDPHVALASC